MATFHFDLVSPEKLLFSGKVEQVDVPGAEGDFGVFEGHAPMVTLLRPGILTIHGEQGEQQVVVHGGFAEVSAAGLTVLADVAEDVAEIDQAALAEHIKTLEESIQSMQPGDALDREIWRLDHFKTVQQHLQGTALH
ncbi:MAG TPA: F0F1 ATP synthase subunit epsilon [Pseudorhodoplanes sp.]|jgi:F-type H+-transporting ATPase subunit epsilon|nr:F0F1 ATP synthase subunit epsilon [Pseudorhodoplanes sp.]